MIYRFNHSIKTVEPESEELKMSESQEIKELSEEIREKKKRISKESELEDEGKLFLQRPVQQVQNLDTNLKNAYHKKHFQTHNFNHMRILKRYRTGKQKDSISSHEDQSDEDFEIEKRPRQKRKNNQSNHDGSRSIPRKRGRPRPLHTIQNEAQTPVRKRGRPKGSGNKKKPEEVKQSEMAAKQTEIKKQQLVLPIEQQSSLQSKSSGQLKKRDEEREQDKHSGSSEEEEQRYESQKNESQQDSFEKPKKKRIEDVESIKDQEQKMQQKEEESEQKSQSSSEKDWKEREISENKSIESQKNRQNMKNNQSIDNKIKEKDDKLKELQLSAERIYESGEESESEKIDLSKPEELVSNKQQEIYSSQSYAPVSNLKTTVVKPKDCQSKLVISKYPRQGQKIIPVQEEDPRRPDRYRALRQEMLIKDEGLKTREEKQITKLLTKRGRKSQGEIDELFRLEKVIEKQKQSAKKNMQLSQKMATEISFKTEKVHIVVPPPTDNSKQVQAKAKVDKVVAPRPGNSKQVQAKTADLQKETSPMEAEGSQSQDEGTQSQDAGEEEINMQEIERQIIDKICRVKAMKMKIQSDTVKESIMVVSPLQPSEMKLFKKWTRFLRACNTQKRIVESQSEEEVFEDLIPERRPKKQKVKRYRKIVLESADESLSCSEQNDKINKKRMKNKRKKRQMDNRGASFQKIVKISKAKHRSPNIEDQ